MKNTKQIMRVLGLTHSEERLFRVLDGVPRSAAELEKRSKLPHATLHGLLDRFIERTLVRSIRLGGKRKGFILNAAALEMSKQKAAGRESLRETGVQVLQGKAALLGLIDTLLVGRRGERMLSFHGPSVLPGWLAILSKSEIKKRNELIIENGIIVERFVPARGYRKLFKSLPINWQQTMLGRAHITYFLPDELFTSKTEVILFSDRVLIYETDKLRMTIFSHKETVRLFAAWFRMLRTLGKKIDSEREFLQYIQAAE